MDGRMEILKEPEENCCFFFVENESSWVAYCHEDRG